VLKDILKIKIVRDFNKIQKVNKLKSNYREKYIKLLDLIETTWYYHQFGNNIRTGKLSISDLYTMDITLFENVVKLNNVKIVKSPIFTIDNIENNQITTISKIVGDFNISNSLNFIRNHRNHIFYIYLIQKNYVRWYQEESKNYLKKHRKEKLENLEIMNI